MQNILLVFLGGGLGSLSRYGISQLFLTTWANKYSATMATLTSNVLASLILAIVWIFIDLGKLPQNLKFLILIGFCGGFSTFSTFSFETFQLLRQGLIGMAILNVLLSVAICLLAIFIVFKYEVQP